MKVDVKMKNHYFHSSVKRTNVFHVAQKKTLHLIKIEIHFVYVVHSTSVKEPLKAKTASNHWSASRMKRFRLVRRIRILIGYGISHDTIWRSKREQRHRLPHTHTLRSIKMMVWCAHAAWILPHRMCRANRQIQPNESHGIERGTVASVWSVRLPLVHVSLSSTVVVSTIASCFFLIYLKSCVYVVRGIK